MSGLSDLLSQAGEGFVRDVADPVGRWAQSVPGAGKQVGEDIGKAARSSYRKGEASQAAYEDALARAQHWAGIPQSQWTYEGYGGDPQKKGKGKKKATEDAATTGPEQPAGYGTGLTMKGGLFDKLAATVPKVPTLEQTLNQAFQPYYNELTNLGPEYQAEMNYLRPYLAPTTGQTFSDVVNQSKAQESPQGNTGVIAADTALQNAMTNQPAPGFRNLAPAGKQMVSGLPYAATLQAVLEAGKNQVLGYSTIPNITNINTTNWPSNVQSILPYLESQIGYNPSTGLPNSKTSQMQQLQQPATFNPQTTQSSSNPGGY
jgi:hypothetical protein